MACALIFIEPIAKIFSTETMLEHTKNYFFYIILATPFMTASFTLNNQLRFQGNAFYGMLGLGFGAILNIILDPIIISLTGDVSGASIATMISQIVGFILLILFSFRSSIKLSLKNLAIKKSIFLEIFKGGLPSLLRQGTVAVSNAVLSLIVVKYGDYAVAGISVAGKVSWIFFSILIGFGQGFQPVCGFNYGAGKMDRVKSAFKFSTIVATLYMALVTIVCMVFSKQLISLFNTAEGGGMQKAIELGSKTIFYHAFAFPLAGLYTTSNMMMQNIGRPVRASILALMRQGLAFIPSILILPSLFSLTGVILAQPVADLISFIVCIPILISVLNEIKKATKNNAN
jgi:Na+-driven multidrug efflux pump